MERGWDATGRLRPLWEKFEGKREELAELTGIRPETLSAYNAGSRKLGLHNGQLIADALGVTIEDLGARPSNVVSINRPDVELLQEAIALMKEIREIQGRIERVAAQVLARTPEAPAEDPPDNPVAERSSPQ